MAGDEYIGLIDQGLFLFLGINMSVNRRADVDSSYQSSMIGDSMNTDASKENQLTHHLSPGCMPLLIVNSLFT